MLYHSRKVPEARPGARLPLPPRLHRARAPGAHLIFNLSSISTI